MTRNTPNSNRTPEPPDASQTRAPPEPPDSASPARRIDPRRLTLRLERMMDLAVGLVLALERERRGLSVEAVASETGLPLDELKDHESGNYPLPVSRMGLLSEALGFDPGVLLEAARLGQRHAMLSLIGKTPEELAARERATTRYTQAEELDTGGSPDS